jgi:hypothetical protein
LSAYPGTPSIIPDGRSNVRYWQILLQKSAMMRTNTAEKVLEKLAMSDKATIVIEHQTDGKMRVTSGS